MSNLTVGERVICNGYPGRVIELCDGQLDGMVIVRLESGDVCMDSTDKRAIRVDTWKHSTRLIRSIKS